jgi:RNA polymerase sigma-70 factor (ECF subfamily)
MQSQIICSNYTSKRYPLRVIKTQGVAILSAQFEMLTDEELMSLYQSGNNESLKFLIKRLRPKMDQVARSKILDRELANDALQEASITIFKTAKSFRSESKVFTWVYRIVTNSCIDLLRKEKTRTSLNESDDSLEYSDGGLGDFTDDLSSTIVIRSAISKLPKDQREAIGLVWIEGYTVEDASELLGIPLGTVKSRCDRGKKVLAEILQELNPKKEPNPKSKRQTSGGEK